jgi:hypothetical protein
VYRYISVHIDNMMTTPLRTSLSATSGTPSDAGEGHIRGEELLAVKLPWWPARLNNQR